MPWRRTPVMGRGDSRSQPVPPATPHPTPVVVLDEDDDDVGDGAAADSEVLIIDDDDDDAEMAGATAAACNSKKGSSSRSNVINIDDDDDDDEEGGGGGDRAGPSTAGAWSPASTTPPWQACPRRYGLDYVSDSEQSDLSGGSESDSDSDGNDSSDCEILGDIGTACKVWEKAASRRTMLYHPQQSKDGRASTSASSAESSTHHDSNLENLFPPFPPMCNLDENISEFFNAAFNSAGPSSTNGAKHGTGPSSVPNAQECPMDNESHGKETEDHIPTCSLDPHMACKDDAIHSHKVPAPEKAEERSRHPHLNGTLEPEGYTSYSFVSANRVFPAHASADCKDDSPIFISTPERMDEKIPEGTSAGKDGQTAHNEVTKPKKKMWFASGDSCMDQLTEDPIFTSRLGCSRQSGEYLSKNAPTNDTSGTCSLKDLVEDPEKISMVQDGLIGAREKHKESDEYKRAQEEEWASRQRQLAIQAEEAQEAKKLRKRKKAEALRRLDMEKRQKQRLEEVRETQRKTEETIHLKEQCRGAVRLELDIIERRYTDMSSILRALGIPVEGVEVKAAYKQALLKFHPDRVSRNDIYEQVKAEETFKFISRFKEKLKI